MVLFARWLALGIAVVVPSVARANDRFALEWVAPEGCPDRAWADAAVEPLLPAGALETTRARVLIESRDGAFEVLVAVRTGPHESERRVRAPTCFGAASAAVAIAALGATRETMVASAAEPPVVPRSVAPATQAPAAATAVEETSSLVVEWDASAGVALDTSLLPAVSPGAFASFGLVFDALRARVLLVWILPERYDANAGIAVRAEIALAEIATCLAFDVAPFEIGGCVGGALGLVAAAPRGPVEADPSSAFFAAFEVGSYARLAVAGDFGLELFAGGLVPLPRYSLVVEGIGILHEMAPVSAVVRLGGTVRFGR